MVEGGFRDTSVVTDPREQKQVCAFVSPTLKRQLETVARRNERSIAAEIRVALNKHLADEAQRL